MSFTVFMSKVSDAGDRLSAHPIFLVFFNAGLVGLWHVFGVDIANIFISIVTAEIVLIGASATRRGFAAIHAKLDEIIHALKEARDDLIDSEKLTEAEIDALRKCRT
jgi:low affinity Fe/Cu permease